MAVTVRRQLGTRYGLGFGVGAILDGQIAPEGFPAGDVGAGFGVFASGSYLAAFERPRSPFLLLSLAISASFTTAASGDDAASRLSAGDARLGVMVGKTIGTRVVPYAAARVFAGPVRWTLDGEPVGGGDVHHYTVGGGVNLRLPAHLDAFVEIMALGEQSAAAGVTLSF